MKLHLAGYPVLSLLGRGGEAEVFRVSLTGGGMGALKRFAPRPFLLTLLGEDEARRRFVAETELLRTLSHPNLVSVLDWGEDESGRPYVLLEHACVSVGALIGETYRAEDRTRALPPGRAVGIACQVLAALSELHTKVAAHRDVKPFNMLVADDGRILLADLGSSRLRGERGETPAGLKVGSPYYAAPEQEDDPGAADERADLYAVAVTLHRLLTGELPPEGGGRLPLARDLTLRFGPDMTAWLKTCLDPDPAGRYASALLAKDALAQAWSKGEPVFAAFCDASGLLDEEPDPNLELLPARADKLPVKAARTALLLDELWRPRPRLGRLDEDEGQIVDLEAGLAWSKTTPAKPMSFREARLHVERLAKLDGLPWRLPTIQEWTRLLGLCRGEAGCSRCQLRPVRAWAWSVTKRTFLARYTVDVAQTAICSADEHCRLGVIAVRNL